jgi:hypothetical protein
MPLFDPVDGISWGVTNSDELTNLDVETAGEIVRINGRGIQQTGTKGFATEAPRQREFSCDRINRMVRMQNRRNFA